MRNFTEEELAIAKSTDLVSVAEALGYTPKRIGHYYTLQEMDSIRIYEHSHWFRWSRRYEKGSNGGSQIDFLRIFQNMEVKEAVFWLVDYAGYHTESIASRTYQQEKTKETSTSKQFELPAESKTNYYLYNYLCGKRGIGRETVQHFADKGLIYEAEKYHNIVFKGNDTEGNTKFASMRGVFDRNGKSFKCDVEGNDKRYGFNIYAEGSKEIHVFEAAIDLMSYADMTADCEQNMIALGMLADAPLATYLTEHPEITEITFHLDNDEPGRKATVSLLEKYQGLGYEVKDEPPLPGYKDMNDMLLGEQGSLIGVSKAR